MRQYKQLITNVLNRGTRKENRTGVDTISTFGEHYNIDLRDGFPLLTTKKINWKNIVMENLWFLSGDPSIKFLQQHGCKFWNAWADEDGMVPSAYGNFWRRFPVHDAEEDAFTTFDDGAGGTYKPDRPMLGLNDQIGWVLAELKRNPMSRRLIVSAWAPGNAQTSALPPCHAMFVFNVQNLPARCADCLEWEHKGGFNSLDCENPDCESGPDISLAGMDTSIEPTPHLCLHLTQRSCDVALGVPYNIAGYAFILELFSRFTGIPAGIFSHSLVDAHIYTSKPDGSMGEYDHVPGLLTQTRRLVKQLPKLVIGEGIKSLADVATWGEYGAETSVIMEHFKLEGYDPHPAIKFKVAV